MISFLSSSLRRCGDISFPPRVAVICSFHCFSLFSGSYCAYFFFVSFVLFMVCGMRYLAVGARFEQHFGVAFLLCPILLNLISLSSEFKILLLKMSSTVSWSQDSTFTLGSYCKATAIYTARRKVLEPSSRHCLDLKALSHHHCYK